MPLPGSGGDGGTAYVGILLEAIYQTREAVTQAIADQDKLKAGSADMTAGYAAMNQVIASLVNRNADLQAQINKVTATLNTQSAALERNSAATAKVSAERARQTKMDLEWFAVQEESQAAIQAQIASEEELASAMSGQAEMLAALSDEWVVYANNVAMANAANAKAQSMMAADSANQRRLNELAIAHQGEGRDKEQEAINDADQMSMNEATRIAVAQEEALAAAKLEDAAAQEELNLEILVAKNENVLFAAAQAEANAAMAGGSNSSRSLATSFFTLRNVIAAVGVAAFAYEAEEANAKMQQMDFGFKAVFGDAARAGDEMAYLRGEAERLGLSFPDITQQYVRFAASGKEIGISGDNMHQLYSSLLQAATVLRLSSSDTTNMLRAVDTMLSKGELTSMNLRRQLSQYIPGAFEIMAQGLGVTSEKLEEMLKKGNVDAKDALMGFADQLNSRYAPAVAQASEGITAQVNRMKNAWFDFLTAAGKSGALEAMASGIEKITSLLKNMTAAMPSSDSGKAALTGLLEGFGSAATWLAVAAGIGAVSAAIKQLMKSAGPAGSALGVGAAAVGVLGHDVAAAGDVVRGYAAGDTASQASGFGMASDAANRAMMVKSQQDVDAQIRRDQDQIKELGRRMSELALQKHGSVLGSELSGAVGGFLNSDSATGIGKLLSGIVGGGKGILDATAGEAGREKDMAATQQSILAIGKIIESLKGNSSALISSATAADTKRKAEQQMTAAIKAANDEVERRARLLDETQGKADTAAVNQFLASATPQQKLGYYQQQQQSAALSKFNTDMQIGLSSSSSAEKQAAYAQNLAEFKTTYADYAKKIVDAKKEIDDKAKKDSDDALARQLQDANFTNWSAKNAATTNISAIEGNRQLSGQQKQQAELPYIQQEIDANTKLISTYQGIAAAAAQADSTDSAAAAKYIDAQKQIASLTEENTRLLQKQKDASMTFTQTMTAGWAKEITDFGTLNDQISKMSFSSLNTGIDSFSSNMTKAILGAQNFGQAFEKTVQSVVEGIIEMTIKIATFEIVAFAVGLAGGGEVPGYATGGEIKGYPGGGVLPGTPSGTDNMLIHAASGEYVVNSAATARNRALLDYINSSGHSGSLPGPAAGLAGSQGGGRQDNRVSVAVFGTEAAVQKHFNSSSGRRLGIDMARQAMTQAGFRAPKSSY